MTLDADGLTSYRECSRPLGLADRRRTSIAGYGDLTVAFRSSGSWVHAKLHDVAHVPLLGYNLVLLTLLAQEGHSSAVEESGVTLNLKGGGKVQFPLIGKLCRQYGYRPEATGRMVDTACAVIAPRQAKAPTTPTDINIFHCIYGHTHEALLKETAEQSGVSLSGELHECRGCGGAQWKRGYGSPSPGRRTPEQVPPAPPAPQQHLPPIAEEGGSTAGEGASGESASSQDGGRVADLDSESDLGMTGVGPVLPATRKAPAAEAGAGTGGVAEGNPPAPTAPSRRAEIGSVNDNSNSSSSSDSNNSKDDSTSRRGSDSNASHTSNASSGDILALTGTEARCLKYFGKPSQTPEQTYEVPITGLDFE